MQKCINVGFAILHSKVPAALLTIHLTLKKSVDTLAIVREEIERGGHIDTNDDAVDFLWNLYLIDVAIAKAA